MIRPLPIASALLAANLVVGSALAQAPPAAPVPAATPAPRAQVAPNSDASLFPPIPTDPADPAYHAGAHRTILRHNPVPQRSASRANVSRTQSSSAGFSNPGGVGKYAEYYDQNTLAPNPDYHPAPVARFDSGGGPDRSEQIAAQQVGIQRSRSIQDHIDAYGRPIGFGYGLGFAGGLGYAFPY